METVKVVDTKKCTKCNETKNTEEFYKKKLKSGNYSHRSHCKACMSTAVPVEVDAEVDEIHQRCTKCNKIKHIDEFNKRTLKSGNIVSRKECKECKSKYNQKYREDNLEDIKEQQKEYCKNNRELKNNYFNERYQSDENFNISIKLRDKLKRIKRNLVLGKISQKIFDLCSCENDQFKKWFEYLTNNTLDWSTFNEKYEIDHIIPVSSFDLTIEEEQKKCFKWSNLRIVTKEDNRSKGKKVIQELIDEYELKVNEFLKTI